MANPSQTVAPVQSAVATTIVAMIGGRPAAEVAESLIDIGRSSAKAEMAMESGKSVLDVCDANLYEWVIVQAKDADGTPRLTPNGKPVMESIPYNEFMLVRDYIVTGHVDGGRTAEGAGKAWERQIKRLGRDHSFIYPKQAEGAAPAMAAKRAAALAVLAAKSDAELAADKVAALAVGDKKSLGAAAALASEQERRAKPELDKADEGRAALMKAVQARAAELRKAKTVIAVGLLHAMLHAGKA